MESDFEVSIEGVAGTAAETPRLPANFSTVGEVRYDDVKVYLKQDVYRAIEEFADSDVAHELGGILLGYESTEMGKTHVVISAFIEARHTDATASTLKFTHETWDYVHAEKDRLYPHSRIVGWQHTHPNYGIFLSEYDLFIQKNYFDLPFQVAYVVDPVAKTRGFFQWKNGNIQKLDGFYVFDDLGKRVDVGSEAGYSGSEPRTRTRTRTGLRLVLLGITLALLVSTVLLSVWVFTMSRDVSRLSSSQDELSRIIQDQHGALADQKAEIVRQQVAVESLKEDLQAATTSATSEGENLAGAVTFRRYRVKRGDSLTAICRKNGIDYRDNIAVIMAVNGLWDANVISAGSTILLPIPESQQE